MTTVVDSRDYTSHSGVDGNPQFRSQCPHCGNVHLHTYRSALKVLGEQKSLVIKCDHNLTESKGYRSTSTGGCGRRYVMDLRIDVLATAIPLTE